MYYINKCELTCLDLTHCRKIMLTSHKKVSNLIFLICSGLEKSIDGLNKDASSTQQLVTLKDVEEGAFALRHVGESLAGLKGEGTSSDHSFILHV